MKFMRYKYQLEPNANSKIRHTNKYNIEKNFSIFEL